MSGMGSTSWDRKQQYTPANVHEVRYHQDRWELPKLPKDAVIMQTQKEDDDDEAGSESKTKPWWKILLASSLRFLFFVAFIGFLLGIPLFVTARFAYTESTNDTDQLKNFIFWVFVWLEFSVAIACIGYITAAAFPYIFYAVASWVNPAHRRYWRIFRPFAPRFTVLFTIVVAWAFFRPLVIDNPAIAYQSKAEEDLETLILVLIIIDNSLMNATFWAVAYLFEKLLITYITIHFHYRSGHRNIEKSKNMINALVTIYDASLSIDPLYCMKFRQQDILIHHASDSAGKKKPQKLQFFQRIGGASRSLLSTFGSMLASDGNSHWLQPGSTYAIVEHALEQPAAAEALAQRIWRSLVPASSTALTKDHIAEVLPFGSKDQAKACFSALDENENGDIRLAEFEMTLKEMGNTRANIYRNLHDIDHAINTFDWIMLVYLALFMLLIILIGYIDFLSKLKDIIGFIGLGAGFAVGRVIADFLMGCVFIFFKHPFDVGDRVDLYNGQEGLAVGVIVKRISLLYCVFQRTDTNATVQYSNSQLWERRIENHTRSGCADEKFVMILNINTSFKDLEYLRDELKVFLARPENSRDYKPGVALRVKSIHELNKMEVAMVVSHKNNWSIDGLKAARSSRIYCALIDIARRIPLSRPTAPITEVGDAVRPHYTIMMSNEEAAERKAADELKLRQQRYDYEVASSDANQLNSQEQASKAAESAAYLNISSIPTAMAGRKADRPAAHAQSGFEQHSSATGVAYVIESDLGSRQRRPVGL